MLNIAKLHFINADYFRELVKGFPEYGVYLK
jgi:hypothetical protein